MISSALWSFVLLTIFCSDAGQLGYRDPARNDKPKNPAEQLKELSKEFDLAQVSFRQQLDACKSPDEREKVRESDPAKTFAPRFLEFARAYPNDAAAPAALDWVLDNLWIGSALNEALEILARNIQDTRMRRVFLNHYGKLGGSLEPGVEKFLQAISSKSKDKDTQGVAYYTLGQHLKLRAKWRKAWEDSDDRMRAKIEKEYGLAFVEKLREARLDKLNMEMEQSFAMVAEKYADMRLKPSEKTIFADRAKSELYEIRHLSTGKVAPEINGKDVDGMALKLSDYRGKVVVLVFWGEWCAACRAMYPQERSLVKRLENKPFALIGINSDADPESLKKHLRTEQITWRSWCDGGRQGPIATSWNVWAWPTVYVLDHKGIIRDKWARGYALEATVDKLLNEIGK
jgi:peroxiredoxin